MSTSGDHGSGSGDPDRTTPHVNHLSSSDGDNATSMDESPSNPGGVASTSGGVEESKTSDPTDLDNQPANPLASTIARLENVVNLALDKLTSGELQELTPQQVAMMDRLFTHAQARRNSSGGKSPAGRSTSGGGGSSSSRQDARGNNKNGKQRRANDSAKDEPRPSSTRPRCTYDRCKKPLGHTYDKCFQRKRDESEKKEAPKPRDDDIIIVKKRRGRSPPSDDEEEA